MVAARMSLESSFPRLLHLMTAIRQVCGGLHVMMLLVVVVVVGVGALHSF
jgi:hypothetical protein